MQTQTTKIVIAGAGFAGTYTFKHLHKYFHKDKNIELYLINRENYFLFTPLLHEVATGSIAPGNTVEPLRKVLRCCLKDLHLGEITNISLTKKQVTTSSGIVPYDYLVIALGSETNFYGIPGAKEHAFTLKTLDDAVRLKNHIIHIFEKAAETKDEKERDNLLTFCIIGGGATGVELAAELSEFLYDSLNEIYEHSHLKKHIRIVLIQKAQELIPSFLEKVREKSLNVLQKKHVVIKLNTQVTRLNKDCIEINNDTNIPSQTTIWVAGVRPTPVSLDVKIEKDPLGKIKVNNHLQIPGHENVFVLGDNASIDDPKTGRPLPQLAQVATKQASCAAYNIHAKIIGKPLKNFTYNSAGELLSLGQWAAAGEIKGFTFFGRIAWWIWRTVYLSKLLSRRKKIEVAIDWTLNLFSHRDISEL